MEKVCALMGCKNIIPQTLEEVNRDKTNSKRIRGQARLLIKMGFKKTDYFCQNCFWK